MTSAPEPGGLYRRLVQSNTGFIRQRETSRQAIKGRFPPWKGIFAMTIGLSIHIPMYPSTVGWPWLVSHMYRANKQTRTGL